MPRDQERRGRAVFQPAQPDLALLGVSRLSRAQSHLAHPIPGARTWSRARSVSDLLWNP